MYAITYIMWKLYNKNLMKVKPYKPGKPIEELRRELSYKGYISKMASNENALSPSKRVRSALRRSLRSLNRYPDGGCFYLKQGLAKKLKLSPDNIVVGNGSDEIIVLALMAFAGAGDEVIIATPTFLIYEIASIIKGVKIRRVPLKNFRYDLPAMAKCLNKRTRIVFIANPDNPTGTYVTAKELDDFMKKTGKNTIVFLDEAYYEFARGFRDYPKSMKYLKDKNIIITRTFSKIYALAGLRAGYGIARKDLIEMMNRVREPFNVNSLAQAACLEALKDDEFARKSLKLTREGKDCLYDNLEMLGLEYVRSATNFVLINLKRDAKEIYAKLLKKGIIVREMSSWGLNGFIRVTVGTMRDNKRFIAAMRQIFTRS